LLYLELGVLLLCNNKYTTVNEVEVIAERGASHAAHAASHAIGGSQLYSTAYGRSSYTILVYFYMMLYGVCTSTEEESTTIIVKY
jgi:hypothetical protein